jgi:hypothetical protein
MSDELLGTNPEAPATPAATATEVAIAATEARLVELNAKKAAEDAIKANSTFRDREAAVDLHATFCPAGGKSDLGHLSLACPWHAASNADSPALADWTEEQHRRWLAIAVVGPVRLRALGWAITPPPEP